MRTRLKICLFLILIYASIERKSFVTWQSTTKGCGTGGGMSEKKDENRTVWQQRVPLPATWKITGYVKEKRDWLCYLCGRVFSDDRGPLHEIARLWDSWPRLLGLFFLCRSRLIVVFRRFFDSIPFQRSDKFIRFYLHPLRIHISDKNLKYGIYIYESWSFLWFGTKDLEILYLPCLGKFSHCLPLK